MGKILKIILLLLLLAGVRLAILNAREAHDYKPTPVNWEKQLIA